MIIPKNELYLTVEDFPTWGDNTKFSDSEKVSSSKKVMNVTLVVTELCNLRCKYCYESHEYHKHGKTMTKQVGKDAIDFLLNNDKINGYFNLEEKPAVILEFIGGEPLLEIDLIDYLTDYFNTKAIELNHPWAFNYAINIGTNGTLYDTEKVKKYLDKNGNSIHMSITIDGNKQLHDSCRVFSDGKGSYDIAEKAIKSEIKRADLKTTKLTIAPENINYLYDAFINCWNLGIQMIYANCVFEDVWDSEIHPAILYNQMKKIADYLIDNRLFNKFTSSLFTENDKTSDLDINYCGGNGSMLAIGADGTCYPCLRFMPHSMKTNKNILTVGNIYDGLLNPKEDKTLCDLCSVTTRSQSPQKCLDCKISTGCGLCTAFNYDYYGTPNKRATFICDMHKARYLASTYYFNKLYRILNLNKRKKLLLEKREVYSIVNDEEYKKLKELK